VVGKFLLIVVEESRKYGKIYGQLNSIFLTNIPKMDKPPSFDSYETISLCNSLYNIISKFIARG
jgi:hypothetical protein